MRPRRVLARVGLAAAVAVALALAVVYALSESRLERRYAVPVDPVPVPADSASIERGRLLAVAVAQCAHCHGDDLAGRPAADDLLLGRLWAPNLTRGRGGIGADYGDADWVRAIRSGLDRDGRPLAIMPAQYLRALGDDDLGALIAFLRSAPPVDRETPPRRVGWLTRAVLVAGMAPDLLPAEAIDPTTPRPATPAPAASPDYGAYLVDVASCRVCHHENLAGGLHPLAVPGEPVPSDLTPAGSTAQWSEREFIDTLRTGVNPAGQVLDPQYMPWPRFGQLSDLELRAIWSYLRSLPPRAPAA